jgi:hypothetical protein
MNLFKSRFMGEVDEVDLDDINFYKEYAPKWTKMTSIELRRDAWHEAGYALIYTQFRHPDVFFGQPQVDRVHDLCKELMTLDQCDNSEENCIKIMSWLFRFKDEIENMC